MAFANFKNLSSVCVKFDCDMEYQSFIKEKKIEVHQVLLDFIKDNLFNNASYINEYVICENIIKPIITIPAKENNLPIWSHTPFYVTDELSGTPDYIFAPALPANQDYKLPIVCLGEAKKDDFTRGWGQTAAEMVAAQIANKNKEVPILGLVTNGTFWQFGKLIGNKFIIEEKAISVTDNLQNVLNVLNWFFCEARKNADILLEIEAKEKKGE